MPSSHKNTSQRTMHGHLSTIEIYALSIISVISILIETVTTFLKVLTKSGESLTGDSLFQQEMKDIF